MIEEKLGIITGTKIITVKGFADDGSEIKIPLCEFKIDTSDIDSDIISEHFPEIKKHLNEEDNSIESVKFSCKRFDLSFSFTHVAIGEEKQSDMVKYEFDHINLTQINLSYKNVNIPTYQFVFEKNIDKNDYYLSNANKVKIRFNLTSNI